MLSKLKLFAFILLSCIYSKSFFSQESKSILVNEKQVVYKLTDYSVATDKYVQKEFKDDTKYKIVYTCIPSGILVIESKSEISSLEKEEIESKLKKSYTILHFFQLQGANMKDCEEKCAKARSVN